MMTAQLLRGGYWKTYLLAAFFSYLVIPALWMALRPGLRRIPGPFLARFTRLYLLRETAKGNGHILYQDLHQKYGKIVRVGPMKVSISDPDIIPVIYNVGSKYPKSSFYSAFTASYKGKLLENLFATQNTDWHKRMKSTVAQAYSLTSLRQLERLVDECSMVFVDAMKDLAGKPIDLGTWLQWYAFDVIGNITFSQTFGFLKNRQDSLGVVDGLEAGTKYNSVIGQMPELHPWLLGNDKLLDLLMLVPAVAKANPITTLKEMTFHAMASHDASDLAQQGDFLEYLRKAQKKEPGRLSDRDIATSLFTNLFAGSDTTAMALRAIFYFLVKNIHAYRKLIAEIEQADREGQFSDFVEFQQGLNLKYLQAVIKESLRLHPGVSLPLERVVPEGGAEFCGIFLPEGTIVGMHAWVVHQDEHIFGKDAHSFRPERWLESDAEQLKKMERCFLSFGFGSRVCLGKNISMLEMTKFVPQVLRQFDVEWASEKAEWEISGYFFAKQSGVVMRLLPKEKPC